MPNSLNEPRADLLMAWLTDCETVWLLKWPTTQAESSRVWEPGWLAASLAAWLAYANGLWLCLRFMRFLTLLCCVLLQPLTEKSHTIRSCFPLTELCMFSFVALFIDLGLAFSLLWWTLKSITSWLCPLSLWITICPLLKYSIRFLSYCYILSVHSKEFTLKNNRKLWSQLSN